MKVYRVGVESANDANIHTFAAKHAKSIRWWPVLDARTNQAK
jgi:hypothetical protein